MTNPPPTKHAPLRTEELRRIARLQDVTAALSSAPTRAEVASVACAHGAEALGAKRASMWLVDDAGDLELIAEKDLPPAWIDRFRHVRHDDEVLPIARCLRSGEAIWIATGEEHAAAHPNLADEARVDDRLNAFATLPLVVSGRVIGVVVFGFEGDHDFTDGERTLAWMLADHSARAIDRARSLDVERSARAGVEAQRDQLALWEGLFSHAGWGVAITSTDERFLAVNPAYAHLHGYEADELIGKSLIDLVAPSQREELLGRTSRISGDGRWAGESVHRRRDGSTFPCLVDVTAVHDDEGQLLYRVANLQDLTDRKRHDAAVALLVDLSRALGATNDRRGVLEAVARLAGSSIADGAAVFADGSATAAAVFHRDPARREALRSAQIQAPRDASSPSDRARLGELGSSRVLIAPLLVRGERVGAVVLVREGASEVPPFGATEIAVAEEVARRTAVALDHLRRLDRERLALQRMTGLQDLASRLARASSPVDVARVAVDAGEHVLGCDAGAVYLVEPGGLRALALRGPSVASEELEDARIPFGSPMPEAICARERRAVWIETEADRERAVDTSSPRGGSPSSVCLPMIVESRVLGVLNYDFVRDHVFGLDERAFLLTLADHCAAALDRARLLESETRANERLQLLVRAGDAFASTFDVEAIQRTLLDLAVPALADVCVFDVTEGNLVQRAAAVAEDPRLGERLEALAWIPTPGFHAGGDPGWREAAGASLDLELPIGVTATLPLLARGERLGVLTLAFRRGGRRHDVEDLRLAEDLARRAAVALERARLYRDAQASARRAEEANRMKDEFLATVSHELRTPLNAIVGWASILRDQKIPTRDTIARGLDVIHKNAVAQARLVDDILDVSRIITAKLRLDRRALDIAKLAGEAIDAVKPAADAKNVEIVARGEVGSGSVFGDPERLRQVVWNLLANAVKFTPAGGRVEVRVERDESGVLLEVKDDGQGIDADFLPYVFERFRQADGTITRKSGGLGLGLAIARHIVEMHGGRIRAESEGLGKGARFVMTLPVRAGSVDDVEITQDGRSSAEARGLVGVRLLIVDDEPDARELLGEILELEGGEAIVAESAEQAMTLLVAARPHVLISDLAMPGEDGFSLIKRIRALDEDAGGRIPAVALTAYTREVDRRRALASGFDAHLRKPVDPKELLSVLADLRRKSVNPGDKSTKD